jgi:sugar (pentulose or hexulose) kinase
MNFYVGIDFGTSGARAIAIDRNKAIQAQIQVNFAQQSPQQWQRALRQLLTQLPHRIRANVGAIAINGTSSTVLLCDAQGRPLTDPLLYNDGRGAKMLDQLRRFAPPNHITLSPTSSLIKLLWWLSQPMYVEASYLLHQADWLAYLLHGKLGLSDYHNALKLGFDPQLMAYPQWLLNLPIASLLPNVLPPGTPVQEIRPNLAQYYQLPKNCLICTGTTDSIAAFLASKASHPGEAVTSLGSTLVLKLLSQTRVEDSRYGIYSHRLGNLWLTGGASNTGGTVLRHYFNDKQLQQLSQQINPELDTDLDYYPLLTPGERFPINDPNLPPRLEPRPDDPVAFLKGLLIGITRIESQGYHLLQELGASPLQRVYTAGGGAKNPVWSQIRQRYLQVPVQASEHIQAAYGTALLAAKGLRG